MMRPLAIKPGSLNLITLHHDDACNFFIDRDPAACNCNPEITVEEVTESNAESVGRRIARDNRRTRRMMQARRN